MRVNPHSTLAISICALALLSQLPSAHSHKGVYNKEGDHPIDTFAQEYVEANKEKLGLSNIRWGGGNGGKLSLARVTWNNQDAFMKCDRASREVKAFKALKEAKRLTDLNTMGRHNVMDPLHQFGFSDSNNQEHFCHLYSYINGVLLDDYFKERTISQIFLITARVLPNIIRGMIYLYNAGIIHNDMSPKNIMLEQDSIGRMIGLKIIDFDLVEVFEKEQGWQPIHPRNREEFSYNPIQRYKSCNGLHFMIVEFLDIFVNPHKTEDPFAHNYVLTGRAAQNYCTRLKRSQKYIKSEQGDLKAAMPAILHLTQAYYTMWRDDFPCSSPLRVLIEEPPRIGTTSRPNSPTFQW